MEAAKTLVDGGNMYLEPVSLKSSPKYRSHQKPRKRFKSSSPQNSNYNDLEDLVAIATEKRFRKHCDPNFILAQNWATEILTDTSVKKALEEEGNRSRIGQSAKLELSFI